MEAWQLWQSMAHESEEAARLAENQGYLRSSTSRYYYSAYQSASALLQYRGLTPPIDREAWNHEETPLLIQSQLGILIRSRDTRNDFARRLRKLYKWRLVADYQGQRSISRLQTETLGRDARYILRVAAEILPGNKGAN